jgi:hypothetical protein
MRNGQILDTHWQPPRTTDSPAEAAG